MLLTVCRQPGPTVPRDDSVIPLLLSRSGKGQHKAAAVPSSPRLHERNSRSLGAAPAKRPSFPQEGTGTSHVLARANAAIHICCNGKVIRLDNLRPGSAQPAINKTLRRGLNPLEGDQKRNGANCDVNLPASAQ